MNKLRKLQDEHAILVGKMSKILDGAKAAGREELIETEVDELNPLEAALVQVKAGMAVAEVEREQERLAARELFSRPGTPGPYFNDDPAPAAERRQGLIGARYKDLFGAEVSSDGWASPNEFFSIVHQGVHHPNLRVAAAAMHESGGSTGGYLVPTEYAAEMLDAAIEKSIVASRARVYPMTSDTKKIAGFDSSTNTAGTLFGGIESQWLGESGAGTVTNPKLRRITLKAKKLALFASSSNELAEDGLTLESQLDEALRVANIWFSDYAFLRGTGAGQPLGVLNDPALIVVDKEEEQDADSLVYANLCNMLGRLHPGCFNKSVWVCNPGCVPQLLQLSLPIGLGGVAIPIMRETDGGFTILTRPVLFTEKLPVLGDKGDLLLADFSQYAIGVRRDMVIEKSAHLRFMEDETVWRVVSRVDGMGRWNKAFTPANGATQSWAVTLEARA